jgi:hypothetical protein
MGQRGFGHRLFADRLVEGGRHAVQDRQRAAGALQHAALVGQFRIHAQRLGVGGDQQFVDLAPFGGHEFERTVGRAECAILQDAAQALAQLRAVVGLAHEAVGAGFQRLHDIVQAGQPGQQHHRQVGVDGIVLQRAAQGESIHPGHRDVADDQVRARRATSASAARAVAGDPHPPAGFAASRRARCCAWVGLSSTTRMSTVFPAPLSLSLRRHLFLGHRYSPDTCNIDRQDG